MGLCGYRSIHTPADIGRAIAGVRAERGLTQAGLAERADIDRGYLARLEAGASPLVLERSLRALRRMGAAITSAASRLGPDGAVTRIHQEDLTAQLDRLVAITTFTVLTGNADAHAKNLAFLHPEPGRIELAPLYDTVPTVLWPKLRTEAAMSIGAQVSLPDVTLKDIVGEGRAWRHPEDRVAAVATGTIEAMTAALERGEIDARSDLAKFIVKRAKQLR